VATVDTDTFTWGDIRGHWWLRTPEQGDQTLMVQQALPMVAVATAVGPHGAWIAAARVDGRVFVCMLAAGGALKVMPVDTGIHWPWASRSRMRLATPPQGQRPVIALWSPGGVGLGVPSTDDHYRLDLWKQPDDGFQPTGWYSEGGSEGIALNGRLGDESLVWTLWPPDPDQHKRRKVPLKPARQRPA
jgi:hypothetical protein